MVGRAGHADHGGVDEGEERRREPDAEGGQAEGGQVAQGGQLEVVLGRKQRRELQRALEDRFDRLEKNLSRIDARLAEATVIGDRVVIFEAVEDTSAGFEGLNEAMRTALWWWLVSSSSKKGGNGSVRTSWLLRLKGSVGSSTVWCHAVEI